jgi:hypothetical protein
MLRQLRSKVMKILRKPLTYELIQINPLFRPLNRLILYISHMTDFKSRSNLRRVNLSLNHIGEKSDGTKILYIRTLWEKDLSEIFPNPISIQTILNSARQTNENNPFLETNQADLWHLTTDVLNSIAVVSAQGYLIKDMLGDNSVISENYIFCLTCEKGPTIGFSKLRIMLIKEKYLKQNDFMSTLHIENRYQSARLFTLSKIVDVYQKTLFNDTAFDHKSWKPPLRRIQLCIPKHNY